MKTLKPTDKRTLRIVKPPSDVTFAELKRNQGSFYVDKLMEAVNTDCAVLIKSSDAYYLHQLKTTAKKINLKLVFAKVGDDLYVKPLMLSEDLRRLLLILRNPRTKNELLAAKFELPLDQVREKLYRERTVDVVKDKYVLSPEGEKLLK